MNDVANVSSEEELLALHSEGKITDEEYQELLGTLRTAGKVQPGLPAPAQAPPPRTSGLAIASLILALALGPIGFIPAIVCGHIALRRIERDSHLAGKGLALAGLIAAYTIFGLTIVLSVPVLLPIIAYRAAAARPATIETTELRWFPLDNTEGLITKSGITIDQAISSDGHGSLRIDATEPTTVRLFETGYFHAENTRLIYQARLRTEKVEGRAYLEMWCHFPSRGEFFSEGLAAPLSGTTAWTTVETPFFLKEGENPDNVRLNLVIDGKGTAWIDDIRLLKGTLP